MSAKAKAEVKPTEYVVLEGLEAKVDQPGGVRHETMVEAWVEVGRATARTKKAAIDEVVGKSTGTFKAVAASSWKGGERRFEQTAMTSQPIP